MQKFNEFNKKHPWLVWNILNLGSLGILMIGWYTNIPSVELLGQIIFWSVSIGAVLLLGLFKLIVYILSRDETTLVDMNNEAFKATNKSLTKLRYSKKKVLINKRTFTDLVNRKIPYAFDLGYDIGVVVLLAYIGYAWLPIFYAVHIIALYYIIEIAHDIDAMPTQELPQEIMEDMKSADEEGVNGEL